MGLQFPSSCATLGNKFIKINMNRGISPIPMRPPMTNSPSRVATLRNPITPGNPRTNASRTNHSPLFSSNASQYMPHVPLKSEPSPGMQTVLRPIAYEAVHVPIGNNVYSPQQNSHTIQPTSTIFFFDGPIRNYSPPQNQAIFSPPTHQGASHVPHYSSVQGSTAPISGTLHPHHPQPVYKPTSVSTYLPPKQPSSAAPQSKDPQPLLVRNPSEISPIKVRNENQENQSEFPREPVSHRSNEDPYQNNYYSRQPQSPKTLNQSKKSLQNDPSSSQLKLGYEKYEDDFKRKVHELQNELHERSNEEFDRSFKHPNPNDRTRFTDIDTRKSDDLRRELQEMEDRLKMYKKEVEHWKQKYHTLENDRRRALDDLQNQYDESMRNQLTGMNGSYNSKMQDLANQIKELQQQLSENTRENEKWRRKCHEYELQQFEWKTKIVDAEAQRDSIKKDYDRVQGQYQRTRNDLDQLKAQQDIQSKRLPRESDLQRLQDLIEQREREIDDLKNRNSQLEMMCVEVKRLDTQNHELDHQLRLSDQNNQLLREQLEKKDRDLVDERQRTQKLLDQLKNFHSHDQRNRSTREDELIEEIERLSYLLNEKNTENMQYQQIIDDLRAQLQRMQLHMNQMKLEYEQEIEELNDKKNRYEQEFRENMEKKFQLLKREIEQLQQERQSLLLEMQQYQQSKIYAETKNTQLQQECDHLTYLLEQRLQDVSNANNNRERLAQQLEQAQRHITDLNGQLQEMKYRPRNDAPKRDSFNSNQFD